MLFVPLLYLGFKLSHGHRDRRAAPRAPDARAFTRSFHLTEGRFERWLEMIAISVFLVVPLWFLMALCFLAVPSSSLERLVLARARCSAAAIMPVIQYAWTFFYLRLEESDRGARRPGRAAAAPFGQSPPRRGASGAPSRRLQASWTWPARGPGGAGVRSDS